MSCLVVIALIAALAANEAKRGSEKTVVYLLL